MGEYRGYVLSTVFHRTPGGLFGATVTVTCPASSQRWAGRVANLANEREAREAITGIARQIVDVQIELLMYCPVRRIH